MGLNVQALRSSFDLVAPRADELAERFYDRLFDDYPELEPLFVGTNFDEQRQKLIQSIALIVKSLEDPEALTRYLHQLGVGHDEKGVTENDYEPVANSLLATLAEIADEHWNQELEDAWTEALETVASIMLEGVEIRRKELVTSGASNVDVQDGTSLNNELPGSEDRDQKADVSAQLEDEDMAVDSVSKNQSQVDAQEADQFYGIVEAAPIAAVHIDASGTINYINALGQEFFREHSETLGFGPEQLVGNPASVFKNVAPELKSAGAGSEVVLHVEDDWYQVRVGSDGQGGVVHYWELANDSVIAQSQIKAVSGAMATIEFEPDGTILWANDHFCGAIGYSLSEIEGQHHRMFCEPEYTQTPAYKEFWANLARGESSTGNFKRIAKGGREIWIEASYIPIIGDDGAVFKVVKYASDVTAQTLRAFEAERVQSMMENIPINVLMADPNGTVNYVNPASLEQLKGLQQFLPVPAEEIVGQSVDIFHKNPAHQRSIFGSADNLPHRASITVGPETLDLLVSPVKDSKGNYLGPMVTWEVVTEKLRLEAEMVRIQNMMENIPINVMMTNRDLELVYLNPASVNTLRPLEHMLPVGVDQMIGQKIDIFHKVPEHQRKMLADPSNLPHRTRIKLGDDTLDLLVTAILDADGNYIGPMATWSVITGQVKMADDFERDVKGVVEVVTAAATEMQASSKSMAATSEETARQSNIVAAASEEATQNVETVSSAAEELSASISEIARHVQDASKMTSQAVEEAENTNVTINSLSESSNEIGQVVKVITSIAQQTNLLALNATIEAARAGEAGKGFAVVANEVKELARQTAKATEEISQKINAIQEATGGAATAIQSIGESIGKINEISTTIASAVEEQTAATNEIARNVTEAARGTSEVSNNITGVSKAAEEGGRGASDIMAAAEGLAKESVTLDKVTSDFLVRMREM